MSEPKFTKGPWRAVVRSNQHGVQSVAVDLVANAWRPNRTHTLTERDAANAHLIAAAPDLYEALEQLLNDYGDAHATHDLGESNGTIMARAALAKAKGE